MNSKSRHPVLRIVRITLGVLLIVLSPLSFFVPLLMGWVMILAGLSLLSTESRVARRILTSIKQIVRSWRRSRRSPRGADGTVRDPRGG